MIPGRKVLESLDPDQSASGGFGSEVRGTLLERVEFTAAEATEVRPQVGAESDCPICISEHEFHA